MILGPFSVEDNTWDNIGRISRIDNMTPAPRTIAHLKGHGLEGLFVTCGNAACLHSTSVPSPRSGSGLPVDRILPALSHGDAV